MNKSFYLRQRTVYLEELPEYNSIKVNRYIQGTFEFFNKEVYRLALSEEQNNISKISVIIDLEHSDLETVTYAFMNEEISESSIYLTTDIQAQKVFIFPPKENPLLFEFIKDLKKYSSDNKDLLPKSRDVLLILYISQGRLIQCVSYFSDDLNLVNSNETS